MYRFTELLYQMIEIPIQKQSMAENILEQTETEALRKILIDYIQQNRKNVQKINHVIRELERTDQKCLACHTYSRLRTTSLKIQEAVHMQQEYSSKKDLLKDLMKNEQNSLAGLIMAQNILAEEQDILSYSPYYIFGYFIEQKNRQIQYLASERNYDVRDLLKTAIDVLLKKKGIYLKLLKTTINEEDKKRLSKMITGTGACLNHYHFTEISMPLSLIEGIDERIYGHYSQLVRHFFENLEGLLESITVEFCLDRERLFKHLKKIESDSLEILEKIQKEILADSNAATSITFYVLAEMIELKKNMIEECFE